ncbi:MAG TPA: hypothetical protein PLI95_04625 [Polyangiaceae bacterium]|nr:hypothetical protein [Polyangiaceae bacterium]
MRSWSLAAVVLMLAVAACDPEPASQLVIPPTDGDAGWDGGELEAGEEDVAEQEAEAGDERWDASATGPEPVVVAVEPLPAEADDGGTEQEALLQAALLSMSTGARGMVMTLRWRDLAGESGAVRRVELGQLAGLLRSQKRQLLLTIGVVDGVRDGRPEGLQGASWSSEGTRQALHGLLDELYPALGVELRYLSLGHEVDRYAAAHPQEREALAAFFAEAVTYANAQPNRPQSVEASVTWSHDAWLSEEPLGGWASAVLEAASPVFVTYAPRESDGRAVGADRPHEDLVRVLERTDKRQIVLAEVMYPSSELIGGGEAEQAAFLGAVFAEVAAHRARVPFVGIASLHDPDPSMCLSRAEASGNAGATEEMFAFFCSIGVRTRTGEAKDAFEAFAAGAAEFMTP